MEAEGTDCGLSFKRKARQNPLWHRSRVKSQKICIPSRFGGPNTEPRKHLATARPRKDLGSERRSTPACGVNSAICLRPRINNQIYVPSIFRRLFFLGFSSAFDFFSILIRGKLLWTAHSLLPRRSLYRFALDEEIYPAGACRNSKMKCVLLPGDQHHDLLKLILQDLLEGTKNGNPLTGIACRSGVVNWLLKREYRASNHSRGYTRVEVSMLSLWDHRIYRLLESPLAKL